MTDHIQENNEPDINLLDLLIALGQEKWTLIVITVLAAITGVVVSLIMPATYVSRTSIMPSQQSGAGGVDLASLGSLAGLAGVGALSSMAAGIKSSDEMFIALLRSQSVQSALIEQFKLKERYGAKNTEEARHTINLNVNIFADKRSGLIFIDAQDKDPEFAAKLANALVEELNVILRRLNVTEVQHRRAYYEQQIVNIQNKIPKLQLEFKEAQKNSKIEVVSLLSDTSTLPGQIAARELQLQVLSRFATSQNPELKKLAVEISALRAQMARYELGKTDPTAMDSNKTNFVLKATQAYNTLKIQEFLLDGYVKQLEIAKVEEAKEGLLVQVVDEAKVPEIRAKPERKKLVLAFTATGLVIALVLAALRVFVSHIQSTSDGKQRWSQLKRAWGFV
jgi:tyrosine-protein kinase Etk/Wzc